MRAIMGRLAVKSVRANLHCPVSLFQSRSNSFFNRFKPNAPMSNVRLNVRLSRPREFLDSSSPSVRSAARLLGHPSRRLRVAFRVLYPAWPAPGMPPHAMERRSSYYSVYK